MERPVLVRAGLVGLFGVGYGRFQGFELAVI